MFGASRNVFKMFGCFEYACAVGFAFTLAHELVFERIVSVLLSMRCAMGIAFFSASKHT